MMLIGKIFETKFLSAGITGLLLLGLLAFTGCWDSGGGSASEGTFIDSHVEGLKYETQTLAGTTDSQGNFQYNEGETVSFSLAGIDLGEAEAKSEVTPVDLVTGAEDATDPAVTNICRLLQSLDKDGDPNNGIQISQEIKSQISSYVKNQGVSIDFEQPMDDFEAQVEEGLFSELNQAGVFEDHSVGNRTLKGVEAARTHLSASLAEHRTVETQYGKLRGFAIDDNTWAWLGVPYAKPPVGERRWEAPQKPDSWNGTREATSYASRAVQGKRANGWFPGEGYQGSEDCLYLDIYRPQNGEENLPVYVWIHGGSNNFGTSQEYDGSTLAKRGNMVVVSIQYRLGPLGWLSHPGFREDGEPLDSSGNYGTLDHIRALRWVQNNISSFGGNPENVTVGGESAGAHNTMNLIMSDKASGLMDKAVVESAAMELHAHNGTYGDALTNGMVDWLLSKDPDAGYSNASQMTDEEIEAYLRAQPADNIFTACAAANDGSQPRHSAFMDGEVLPQSTWGESIQEGNYNASMPVLIGSNKEEWKSFMPVYGPVVSQVSGGAIPHSEYTWADLHQVLVDPTLDLEDVLLPEEDDQGFYDKIGELRSRGWKLNYVDNLAHDFTSQGTDVYAYRFDWAGGGVLPDFETIFGAGHGMEVPFFFGDEESAFGYSFVEVNELGRKDLQEAMMAYLASFVHEGNPNSYQFSDQLRPKNWDTWSNSDGVSKFIVFDADDSIANLNMNSTRVNGTALAEDIFEARNTYNSTAEHDVFDMFGLTVQ